MSGRARSSCRWRTDAAVYDVVSALSRVDTPLSTWNKLRNDEAKATAMAREAVDHADRYF